MEYLSSFDLLLYTARYCDISLLCTLATVSSFFRSVANSDKCWRPRLQAALAIAASLHPDDTKSAELEEQTAEASATSSDASSSSSSPSSSSCLSNCKAAYLQRFACSHAAYNGCYRLILPTPLISHPRIVPAVEPQQQQQRHHEEPQHLRAEVFACACSPPVPIRASPLCRQCVTRLSSAVQRWYDTQSILQHQFTMTPLTVALLSDAAVDVKYRHVGLYEGIDYRRFTFLPPAASQQTEHSGACVITGFREHRSGCYALNLRENVQDSEGRRAGSLQQTAQESVQLIRAQPPALAAVRLVNRPRHGLHVLLRARQHEDGRFGGGAQ